MKVKNLNEKGTYLTVEIVPKGIFTVFSIVLALVLFSFPSIASQQEGTSSSAAGCPPEMANIDNQFCIDKWEAHIVDKTTKQVASPFYTPRFEGGYLAANTVYATYKKKPVTTTIPEISEFQKASSFIAVAVSAKGVIPQGYMTKPEAANACANAGKRLCSFAEWYKACVGPSGPSAGSSKDYSQRYFPYGPSYRKGKCNVQACSPWSGSGRSNTEMQAPELGAYSASHGCLAKTGQFSDCTNEYGVFDMHGNQDEIVSDEGNSPSNMLFAGEFFGRGRKNSMGCAERISVHAKEYYDYSIGFRCCANIGQVTVPSPVGITSPVPSVLPLVPPAFTPSACPPGYITKPAVPVTASAQKAGVPAVVPAVFKQTQGEVVPVEVVPGSGGCAEGMVAINDKVCIDMFEGSLVRPDGSAFPYYENPRKEISSLKARSVKGVKPQGQISGTHAENACVNAGKRLCTENEWMAACTGGDSRRAYPYGSVRKDGECHDESKGKSGLSAVYGSGVYSDAALLTKAQQDPKVLQVPGTVVESGSYAGCVSKVGAFDMVGNLHEWISTPSEKGKGQFKGGWFLDTKINSPGKVGGCSYKTRAHAFTYSDWSTGFRCCMDKGAGGDAAPSAPVPPSTHTPPPVTSLAVLSDPSNARTSHVETSAAPLVGGNSHQNDLITGFASVGTTASPKLALKQIAEQEYARWGNGRKKESEPEMKPIVARYFEAGGCPGSDPTVIPWSAAFISWVAKQAGISDFPANCAHTQYFSSIQKNPGTCTAHPISEKSQIEVGDIICECRKDPQRDDGKTECHINYNNVYGLSHCDIVVSLNNGGEAIGGNVNNAVDMKKNVLNDKRYFGFLSCGASGKGLAGGGVVLASVQAAVPTGPVCPTGSIVVVGDSMTVGGGGRNNYPDMIEDKIKELCPQARVQHDDGNPATLSAGPKGGAPPPGSLRDTYAYVGKTSSGMKGDFDAVLVGGHREVIILGGGNDLAGGVSAKQIEENLADMYARAKQKGLRVIAVTTTPWKGYAQGTSVGWTEKKFEQQQELNKWILSGPAHVDVSVDVYPVLDDPANPGALKPETGTVDKIHPGVAGFRLIADAIFTAAYAKVAEPGMPAPGVPFEASLVTARPQCVPAPVSSIYDFIVVSQGGVTNVLGIARQNLAVGMKRREMLATQPPSLATAAKPISAGQAGAGTTVRSTEALKEVYGSSEQEISAQLVPVTFRGKKASVHRKIVEAFKYIDAEIEKCPEGKAYQVKEFQTFNWRPIRGKENEPEKLSMHSFGIAVDINPKENPMRDDGVLQTDMPKCFVDAFKKYGFRWGGDWGKRKDAMHFEFRGDPASIGADESEKHREVFA